ncbi:MAG: hypothetical protein H6611_08130 [Ignavibacteriales bacterium]|nr:hypothetical protein [Ignavibacteriales bacterium]
MGYRKDFEILLEEIFSSIKVSRIGHDDKAVKGNKPDFIIHKSGIPLLYIETKDIGVSLEKIEKSEQMKRYFGYVLMRKLVNTEKYPTVFLSNTLVDINFYGFQTYFFPLYLYSKDGTKIPNLNQEI